MNHADTANVLYQVHNERVRQDRKFGEQNPPDGTGSDWQVSNATTDRAECDRAFKDGTGTWYHILNEEVAEAFAEHDPKKLRTELIQVAAVATAWVEAIDRRAA